MDLQEIFGLGWFYTTCRSWQPAEREDQTPQSLFLKYHHQRRKIPDSV